MIGVERDDYLVRKALDTQFALYLNVPTPQDMLRIAGYARLRNRKPTVVCDIGGNQFIPPILRSQVYANCRESDLCV